MTLITARLALGNAEDPARFANHVDAVLCCARGVPLFPAYSDDVNEAFRRCE